LIKVRGDVSSQFLTALLMSLPLVAKNEICIEVIGELISKPYIDITLKLMKRFGVDVRNDNWQKFYIPANGGQPYSSPGTLYVEGDASSASYFLAAGAISQGPVRVTGVGRNSIQGDVAFAEALNQMGANVMAGDDWIEVRGVDTPSGKLQGIELNCLAIPDAAMTLAVAALFAEGSTKLTGIASWKVKETDRIAAMANELRKVGAMVDSGDDTFRSHRQNIGSLQSKALIRMMIIAWRCVFLWPLLDLCGSGSMILLVWQKHSQSISKSFLKLQNQSN